MKQIFALFLTSLVGVSPVGASLGDNDDQIENAYGQVVKRHLLDDGTVSVLYHKDRYIYLVMFNERRSVLEQYSRIDQRDLSDKEIARFLKANAGKRVTWKRHDTPNERKFERGDHKAEATYFKMDGRPTLKVENKK